MHGSQRFPRGCEIVDSLQAQQESLGTGFTVTFAAQKATETGTICMASRSLGGSSGGVGFWVI